MEIKKQLNNQMVYLTLHSGSAQMILFIASILFLLISNQSRAQSIDALRQEIQQIISAKEAHVGIAISGNAGRDTLSIHGDDHYPMQSVFKFHIGLAMLAQIDKGNFSLDQEIEIQKKDLIQDIYSPIRDTYPNGVTLTIGEIMKYTVSQSDNIGCDILLRLLGGPQAVEDYIKGFGFEDIAIKINEEVMQANWDMQFLNWTTPNTMNQILEMFYVNDEKLLSPESHDYIWRLMLETSTGAKRLKGNLPEGTSVAHKTGWSGAHPTTGVTAAVNDVGIVFLPNGGHFYICVFVSNSTEDPASNERIVAEIAKAAYDYFVRIAE